MSKKVVLTGGPGVGKTSIIQYLEEHNYSIRREVFTELFAKAQIEGRFSEDFLHSQEIIHELTEAQIALETTPEKNLSPNSVLFLDRSRIDIWGFAKNMKIVPYLNDKINLENGEYHTVFVIEPIPPKFYDQNEVRRQTYAESLEHHRAIIERYQEFLEYKNQVSKVSLISVPFIENGSPSLVSERAKFILNRIFN